MSHFIVLVAARNEKKLEEILAPYDEELRDTFVDDTDDLWEEYQETESWFAKDPEGNCQYLYNDDFLIVGAARWRPESYDLPDGWEKVKLPVEEVVSFDEWAKDVLSESIEVDGVKRYGYMRNPKAKWDWWTIGGRWSGWLLTFDGKQVSRAKANEIDWDGMLKANEEEPRKQYRLFKEIRSRFGEEISSADKEEIALEIARNKIYLSETIFEILENSETENEYVAKTVRFPRPFAFVEEDGTWHEKAEMGWFATTTNPNDDYEREFQDFLRSISGDCNLFVVDCHI